MFSGLPPKAPTHPLLMSQMCQERKYLGSSLFYSRSHLLPDPIESARRIPSCTRRNLPVFLVRLMQPALHLAIQFVERGNANLERHRAGLRGLEATNG